MSLLDFLGGLGPAALGGPQKMALGLVGNQVGINPGGLLGQFLGIPGLDPLGREKNNQVEPSASAVMGTPGFNGEAAQQPSSAPTLSPAAASIAMAPQQQAQPIQQPMQQQGGGIFRKGGGLRDFFGNLGDVMLAGNGAAPIYGPMKQQQQMGQALAQYLGTDDPGLAQLLAQFPQAGMELYNAKRDDKRFDRTAGQTDRQLGQGDRRLDLGYDQLRQQGMLDEARIDTTRRGQDVQVKLQQLRMQDAALNRQQQAAIAQGNNQAAMQLEQLRQANRIEIARLSGGGDTGTITETVEYPGEDAETTWYGRETSPAKPSRKVVTKRPAQSQGGSWPSKQQWESASSGTVFNTPDGPMRKP